MCVSLRSSLASAVASLMLLAVPPGTFAQLAPAPTPIPTWGPNGDVHALARAGDTLFVGGDFDYVGPPTASVAVASVVDAADVTSPAGLRGATRKVISDEAGGWFVMAADGPPARPAIVRVRPDGTVDPAWRAPAFGDGPWPQGLADMVLLAGKLFVGGYFITVDAVTRPGLVALDPSSGALLPWDAHVLGLVSAIAADGGRLYLAGSFNGAGGGPGLGLAAIDSATGTSLPFDPPQGGTSFAAIYAAGGRVYVTGICKQTVGGPPRGVCGYDSSGAALSGFDLSQVTGPLVATPSRLYALAQECCYPNRVVALDPATGARLPWMSPPVTGVVTTMSATPSHLYIGGGFDSVGASTRRRLAAFDTSTGELVDWNPFVSDRVVSIATGGGRVAFGGAFASVGGVPRRNLAAIDIRTGRAMPHVFDLEHVVNALAIQSDLLVAAGQHVIDSQRLEDVTAHVASTGRRLPWSLSTNGFVSTMAVHDATLFLGGSFSAISGTPRQYLAAVDLRTGTLTTWNPLPDRAVSRLDVSRLGLYVSGYFNSFPGYGRQGTAAFDLDSLELLPFSPTPGPPPTTAAYAFWRDRVLIAGIQPTPNSGARWVDAVSGAALPVESPVPFEVAAAARSGDTIVLGGYTSNLIDTGLTAIHAVTGRRLDWAPSPSSTISTRFSKVTTALGAPDLIVVGGRFEEVGGIAVRNVAVFRMPAPSRPHTLHADVRNNTVTLEWTPGPALSGSTMAVEAGTTPGSADLGRVNVGQATQVSGTLAPGIYYTRVRGIDAGGEGAASSEVILTVPAVAAPPNTPGALTSTVAANIVTLNWGAGSGNPTSYVLDVGTQSGLSNVASLATGHLDTTFATPAPAGTYYVRLRAVNAFGSSAATNEVVVVVP